AGYADVFDVLGFSYYSAMGVTASAEFTPHPPGHRVGLMGYAPWSDGLGVVLDRLHDALPGTPLLIAEHGVGTDDDAWRCEVLRDSLTVVADRVAAGIDIR